MAFLRQQFLNGEPETKFLKVESSRTFWDKRRTQDADNEKMMRQFRPKHTAKWEEYRKKYSTIEDMHFKVCPLKRTNEQTEYFYSDQ
jgi:hypothetical protein